MISMEKETIRTQKVINAIADRLYQRCLEYGINFYTQAVVRKEKLVDELLFSEFGIVDERTYEKYWKRFIQMRWLNAAETPGAAYPGPNFALVIARGGVVFSSRSGKKEVTLDSVGFWEGE